MKYHFYTTCATRFFSNNLCEFSEKFPFRKEKNICEPRSLLAFHDHVLIARFRNSSSDNEKLLLVSGLNDHAARSLSMNGICELIVL